VSSSWGGGGVRAFGGLAIVATLIAMSGGTAMAQDSRLNSSQPQPTRRVRPGTAPSWVRVRHAWPRACTVPSAVSGVTAKAGPNEATISWTAGSDGGSALTAYVVREVSGKNAGQSIANNGSVTHVTMTGLAGGTAATFSVRAESSCGSGPATTSASVIPTGTSTTFASTVISDKPSVYYRLGDPSGSVMADSSGHGQDGVYATQTVLAQPGALLSDPGATSVEPPGNSGSQGVSLGDSSATMPQFNDPRTVSAWVKSTDTGNTLIAAWGTTAQDQSFIVGFQPQGIFVDGYSDGHVIPTSHPVSDGAWHLVTVTYDGTTISAYLDGRLQGTAHFTGTISTQGSSLVIGASPYYYGSLIGGMQDFAVYPSALTAAEISAQYAASGYKAPAMPPDARASQGGPNGAQVTWGDISSVVEPITQYVVTVASGPSAGMSEAVPGSATGAEMGGLLPGPATFTVTPTNASGAGTAATTNSYTVTGSPSTYSSTVRSDKPAAYYRLSDTTDLVMTDSSGHRANGSYEVGDQTFGASGPIVGDPSTGVDLATQYTSGTASPSLPLNDSQRTVEAWFDIPAGANDGGVLVGWGQATTDQAFDVGVGPTDVFVDGWSDTQYFSTPRAINDGSWHQLDVTYDGTTITVYLDGVSIGTGQFDGALGTVPSSLYLGSDVQGYGGPGGGVGLAQVSVYPTALSPARVAAHFAASGNARPAAPTSVTAVAGTNRATVHWTAPSSTTAPLRYYTVTALASGITAGNSVSVPSTATSAVIGGLAGGTSYTFQVAVGNAYGSGQPGKSTSVTPTGTASTYSTAVEADKPSSYYRLADTSDLVMTDSSGHEHAGSYESGNVSLGVAGPVIGDPSTAVSLQNGSVAATASPPLPLFNSQRTVEAWFDIPSGSGANGVVVSWGQAGTDNAFDVGIGPNYVFLDGWNDSHYFSTPYSLNDGNWHQVAVTYSGSTIIAYLDGVAIGKAQFNGTLDTLPSDLYLGANLQNNGGPGGGVGLAQVSVYPDVLSAARIAAHFAATGRSRPATPSAPTATAGSDRATVDWNKVTAAGTPVLAYQVTALAGGTTPELSIAVPAADDQAVVSGLVSGQSYTFEVRAEDAYGWGRESPPSATLAPTGPTSNYSSEVLSDNPSAYYRLSDRSDYVMSDSSRHQASGSYMPGDVSLGVAGPILGDPSTGVALENGNAAGSATPALPLYNAARTFETWFEIPAGSGASGVIAGWGQPGNDNAFDIGVGSSYVSVGWWSDSDSFSTPYPINDGNWHQLAVSYNGSTIAAYLDGVLIGHKPFSGSLDTLPSALYIGADVQNGNGPGGGVGLAQMSIYPSALTASTIAAHFDASGYRRPGAPSALSAQPGVNKVTVGWTAPSAGTKPISYYEVTAYAAGTTTPFNSESVPGTATSAVIGGLAGGKAYVFKVTAFNAYGSGPAATSSAVTPTGNASTYSIAVAADSPAAYYRLADSSIGAMTDSSAHGATGEYSSGNVSFGLAGPVVGDPSTAISLQDGSAAGSASPTLPIGNSSRSVETWFEIPSGSGAAGDIIGWGQPGTDNAFDVGIGQNYAVVDGWNDTHYFSTPYPINDGVWHQLVVTYDGATISLYLDGTLIGTSHFGSTLNTLPSSLWIGSNVQNNNGPGNGVGLAQLSVYPGVLSATVVAAHFAASGNSRPTAPSALTAEAGTNQVTVSWTAATSATSAITSYLVTAYDGTTPQNAEAVAGSDTSAVLSGLKAGTKYTFTVVARNHYGPGPPATSPAATPTGTATTYASTVLADGPVAYYRLGDSATTLMADSSGKRANGTYNASSVTLGVAGAISNDPDTAAETNGGPLGTATPLLPSEQHARTVVAWVNPTNGGQQYVVGWGQTSNSEGFSVGFAQNDIYVDEYGNTLTFATTASVTSGAWHQIAVTADGTAATAYLDGKSLGTQSFPVTLDTAPDSTLYLGAAVWGGTGLYGDLDEVAIFPTELSSTAISSLYGNAISSPRKNTTGHRSAPRSLAAAPKEPSAVLRSSKGRER
jgi:hypothetical protein